jgi:Ca-activated chloride channel family protein
MFLFITVVTVLAISAMAGIKYAGLPGLFPDQVRAIIAEAPVKVTISSSVTKQRWMEEMARRFTQSGARTSAGQPIAIDVKGVLSGDSMDRIVSGEEQPVAWSPGETSWVAQLDARWRTSHGSPISSAACKPTIYTPSGIAMWRPMAEALGWPSKPVSWKSIIALASDPQGWGRYGHPEWGQLKLGYTHPQYSSAGLLFLASVIYGQVGKTEGLTPQDVYSAPVEEALSAMARKTSKYGMVTTNLLDMMARQGPDFLHAIAGFEEGVVRFNLERQA